SVCVCVCVCVWRDLSVCVCVCVCVCVKKRSTVEWTRAQLDGKVDQVPTRGEKVADRRMGQRSSERVGFVLRSVCVCVCVCMCVCVCVCVCVWRQRDGEWSGHIIYLLVTTE